MQLYKARVQYVENIWLGAPTMHLRGYSDRPVMKLGSCTVFLYHGNEKYRVLYEEAESKGHMILGKEQSLRMKYVGLPQTVSKLSM